jgi:hypothetical protein
MWKSCVRGKQKFFFWLLLKDRLSTRNLLRRKHMSLPDYNCVLCTTNVEETLQTLIFLNALSTNGVLEICECLSKHPTKYDHSKSQTIQFKNPREVIMVAGWSIWCHTNTVIYDGAPFSLGRWKDGFKINFLLLITEPNLPPRFC